MSSPLNGFANCTLNFSVPSTQTELDTFGNTVSVSRSLPVVAMMKILIAGLELRLLQQNRREEDDAIALSGYCVSPMSLPVEIEEQSTAKVTFNGRRGEFWLVLINPPYGRAGIGSILNEAIGTKLLGWFVPDR
jgi:hypothetical protein